MGVLEGGGGEAGEVLEVFAEGGLVGEVQLIGDLLDILSGVAQQVFRFLDDILVYPFPG